LCDGEFTVGDAEQIYTSSILLTWGMWNSVPYGRFLRTAEHRRSVKWILCISSNGRMTIDMNWIGSNENSHNVYYYSSKRLEIHRKSRMGGSTFSDQAADDRENSNMQSTFSWV
jgi:hypothetical protein